MNRTLTTESCVLFDGDGTLDVTDLELEEPRAGEVLVELAASGICHSDVSVSQRRLPHPLPVVLGHEGAGWVQRVGAGVSYLSEGDPVVLSWMDQCGECFFCERQQAQLCERVGVAFAHGTLPDGSTRFRTAGKEPVFQMSGLGTLSRHCVVPASSAVRLPDSMPLGPAALLGCAVLTGWGAAVNKARVRDGETVVVLGCGGIGLNAIQGARMAGAGRIIAIDTAASALALAATCGATHVLDASDAIVADVRELTEGRGADAVIEAVGAQATVDQAVAMTRKGGRCVLVSAPPPRVQVTTRAFTGLVMTEKIITGSLYGSATIRRDIPALVQAYQSGSLLLDELIGTRVPLAEASNAFKYSAEARGGRAMVDFSL